MFSFTEGIPGSLLGFYSRFLLASTPQKPSFALSNQRVPKGSPLHHYHMEKDTDNRCRPSGADAVCYDPVSKYWAVAWSHFLSQPPVLERKLYSAVHWDAELGWGLEELNSVHLCHDPSSLSWVYRGVCFTSSYKKPYEGWCMRGYKPTKWWFVSKDLKIVSLYMRWDGLTQSERISVRSQKWTCGYLAHGRWWSNISSPS